MIFRNRADGWWLNSWRRSPILLICFGIVVKVYSCPSPDGGVSLGMVVAIKWRRLSCKLTASRVVMLRYIENNFDIDVSNRIRISSAGWISIFFDISSRPFLSLRVDFIFIDSNAGNTEFGYDRGQTDRLTQYWYLTIWHAWYFANDMQQLSSSSNFRQWNSLTWDNTIHVKKTSTL